MDIKQVPPLICDEEKVVQYLMGLNCNQKAAGLNPSMVT